MNGRIFSGVQPTGNLHLGNYLGAIRNWVQMQQNYECIFCIVDLHAITVPQEPAALRNATREVTAAYIACGIDPEKATIFHQSAVSVHAELAWVLGCFTPLGWLNRMTQFKEKSGEMRKISEKWFEELNALNEESLKLFNFKFIREEVLGKLEGIPAENSNQSFVEYAKNLKSLIKKLEKFEEAIKLVKNEILERNIRIIKELILKTIGLVRTFENESENLEGEVGRVNRFLLRLEDHLREQITLIIQSISDLPRTLSDTLKKYEQASLGLYSYPVLMAADILGYKATHVPVGEDQKQHLELARDIAGAFNRRYETEFFPLPEPVITGAATRVMSLRDGTKKMSKSDPSDYSRIALTDDADTIAAKIRKAKSDMVEGMSWDPENRPEAANLINIYSVLANESREAVIERYASSGFAPFKKDLADVAVAHLAPITAKMRELLADPAYIDSILRKGAENANAIAQGVLAEVKDMVGFLRV